MTKLVVLSRSEYRDLRERGYRIGKKEEEPTWTYTEPPALIAGVCKCGSRIAGAVTEHLTTGEIMDLTRDWAERGLRMEAHDGDASIEIRGCKCPEETD